MKIKKNLTYLALPLIISAGVYLSIEPPYDPPSLEAQKALSRGHQVIAHKGFVSGTLAGNSLECIQEALKTDVQGLEVDVHCSKDNVFFLYHDDTLEELTNGHGRPEDYTWEELSKFVYTDAKASHLMRLDDLFKLVGSKKMICLDTKFDVFFDKSICKNLADLIFKYKVQKTVFIESFNPLFLVSMRKTAPELFLMYDFATNIQAFGEEKQGYLNKIPWALRQPWVQKQIRRITKPNVLGPRFNCDKGLLKNLAQHGYPIITWSVDDPAIAQQLFDVGVRGAQSNKPLDLLKNIPEAYFEKEAPMAGTSTSNP